MFENFIITDHVLERYYERVGSGSKEEFRKRVKKDLHFTKVKKIINNGNHRHIFTRNSKEFIFKKDKNKWILKTIIKRSRTTNPGAIEQRMMAAAR